jgi:NAD(P)H dehydrogenase (quinone)
MEHVVVVAHPDPGSFTLSLASAYCAAALKAGQHPILRDLYRMKFDPCLRNEEIPRPSGFAAAPDATAERELIADAGVFVFVYPFWFNAPPAMLIGYIDRILSAGFGFQPGAWGSEPLLKGRKLISLTVSGAPTTWVKETGAMQAHNRLFAEHVAAVCGIDVLDHLHFGGVHTGIRADFVEKSLAMISALVTRHFSCKPDKAEGASASERL